MPYLYGPGCVALVWDEGSGAVGYVVGTVDTIAFQRWFVEKWWPSLRDRRPRTEADRWLLPSAADPERMISSVVEEYPAHLHIDLHPDAQGKGIGRALMEAWLAELHQREVAGVHLVAPRDNAGAQAFYPRVGFTPIAEDHGSVTFARHLAARGVGAVP